MKLSDIKVKNDSRPLPEIGQDILRKIRKAHELGIRLSPNELAEEHGVLNALLVIWKLDDAGYDVITGQKKSQTIRSDVRDNPCCV